MGLRLGLELEFSGLGFELGLLLRLGLGSELWFRVRVQVRALGCCFRVKE